jgi:hypothetical protein
MPFLAGRGVDVDQGANPRSPQLAKHKAVQSGNPTTTPTLEGEEMATKQTKTETTHPPTRAAHAHGSAPAHARTGDGGARAENAGQVVQQGIAESLAMLDSVEGKITALVRKTVADSLGTGGGAADELVGVIQHVVEGAIVASQQVGSGLAISTKSVAKGIIAGVHDVGGDVVVASFEVTRSLILVTATLGADLGMVARRAIDGLIEATGEIGGDVGQIGRRAIQGAIEAAGEISHTGVRTVTDVLIGIASGLGQTIEAMLPHGSHARTALEQPPAGGKPQHH